jgi:hypothetical protein
MFLKKNKNEDLCLSSCNIRHINESGARFRIIKTGDYFYPQVWIDESDGWKMHAHTQYLYADTAEECERKLRKYENKIANANYSPVVIKNIFI